MWEVDPIRAITSNSIKANNVFIDFLPVISFVPGCGGHTREDMGFRGISPGTSHGLSSLKFRTTLWIPRVIIVAVLPLFFLNSLHGEIFNLF